jgi:succinate dehydrogenase/fumarate reductase cytochrome b subunit
MSPFWNYRWSRTFFNPSTIQRYTALALIVGLVTLVCFLWAVAAGAYNYPRAANLFARPLFRAFLVILTWSLIYKMLTGTTDPRLGGRYGSERNAARVSRITVIATTTLLTVTALLPALLGH